MAFIKFSLRLKKIQAIKINIFLFASLNLATQSKIADFKYIFHIFQCTAASPR